MRQEESKETDYIMPQKLIIDVLDEDWADLMKPVIKDVDSFSGDPCGKEAEHRFRVFMQFALCLKIQSGMVPKDAYGEYVTALSTDRLMQEARTLYKEQLTRSRPNGVPVLQ